MGDEILFRKGRGEALRRLLTKQIGERAPEPEASHVGVQNSEKIVPRGRASLLGLMKLTSEINRPLTNGINGPQTNGINGPQTNGIHGPQTSGIHGPQTNGIYGPQTSGIHGPQTIGIYGPQTSGIHGPQINGIYGPQTNGIPGPITNGTNEPLANSTITSAMSSLSVHKSPVSSKSEDKSQSMQVTPPSIGKGRAKLMTMLKKAESQTPNDKIPSPKLNPIIKKSEPPKPEPAVVDNEIQEPVVMLGTSGVKTLVTCNYIRLYVEPDKGVFQYIVKFTPEVDSKQFRCQLMKTMTDRIGDTKSFDGTTLFLPHQLPDKVTMGEGELPTDKSHVSIQITFIKKLSSGHKDVIQLYNIVFRRIMHMLGYILHGDNYFDPKSSISVPAHKLEIWPGYISSIQDFEGGILICCDASHRVLRTQTVHEYMQDMQHLKRNDWKEIFTQNMVGQSVLTRYNNKTYKIDNINFNINPTNTFNYHDTQQMSYINYYEKQYGVQIKDHTQPLLQSQVKYKVRGESSTQMVDLIPELCYLSGLTDEIRSDMRIMKDVATHTRISPNQRRSLLRDYINNIQKHEGATNLLKRWGLSIDNKTLSLEARVLDPENIHFGNSIHKGTASAEWTQKASQSHVTSAIDLNNWVIVCARQDERKILEFVAMVMKCAPQIGLKIVKPVVKPIPNDSTQNFLSAIKSVMGDANLQMLVFVLPKPRADKYSAIKKFCCTDFPVPSQVIQVRTISKPDKLRSIVLKIIMQMNCKLGGTLWSVKIPVKNTMVIGLDTYHDPTSAKKSVGAVVASMNPSLTRWYSRAYLQQPGAELISGLEIAILNCLLYYKSVNGTFPEQIAIYRDGVGDGQIPFAREHEVPQIITAINRISPDYTPMILFVIVQKRIHSRIFTKDENNPPPGTVVDHTICRKNFYDFFLVAQNVRQGTVTPTHYVVIYNSTKMSPDQVQRFSFKLTHLYYNWPGTVRVPAPCQYAHKLAQLIGDSIGREAAETLSNKLFYL